MPKRIYIAQGELVRTKIATMGGRVPAGSIGRAINTIERGGLAGVLINGERCVYCDYEVERVRPNTKQMRGVWL